MSVEVCLLPNCHAQKCVFHASMQVCLCESAICVYVCVAKLIARRHTHTFHAFCKIVNVYLLYLCICICG